MKKFLLIITLVYLFSVRVSAAGDILILQSLPIKPYDEALHAFRSVCKARTQKLVTSDLSEGEITAKVRKTRPDLILAIGQDALVKARALREPPVVYVMVLNPHALTRGYDNVTGVGMHVAPEKQLAQLRQILPHLRKIGLLFDPAKSGDFVSKAYGAASLTGIDLITRTVHTSREAVASIEGLKGKVDALWLLPDTTIVNPATIDILLLAAIENRIPVLTFSEKYTEKGALLSMEVDPREAGRQAGEMANRILAGKSVKEIEKEETRGYILSVNTIIAKKLGITMNGNSVKQARIIK